MGWGLGLGLGLGLGRGICWVEHAPMRSSSSSMRERAASFMLMGLSPADSDTRRRKVKADLASHTAPKRVATQLIA